MTFHNVRGPGGRFASIGKGRVHRKRVGSGGNVSKTVPHTNFVFVLDASASMSDIKYAAIKAFNQQLETIEQGCRDNNQTASVSLIVFGEVAGGPAYPYWYPPQVRYLWASKGSPLTEFTYRPQGDTALLDSIGRAIKELEAKSCAPNEAHVVIVITDGQENNSREYSSLALRDMIARVTATDRYTITFSGPRGSRHQIGALGLPMGNVQEWEQTDAGMYAAAAAVSIGTTSYYQTRSTGATSTKGFFTTDTSKLTSAKVNKKLEDIRNRVNIWAVPAETDIRTFVESHGCTYGLGRAYYQLTKAEKIQAHKDVILKKKFTGEVYGGREARDLLGLPDFEVKCVPGNHGDWDIFVQSTSTNRKLVRGTQLVYVK